MYVCVRVRVRVCMCVCVVYVFPLTRYYLGRMCVVQKAQNVN